MGASYYTSYETSVALKEAGAPQGHPEMSWYSAAGPDGTRVPHLIKYHGEARAFRLDEILRELWLASVRDVVLLRMNNRSVIVEVFDTDAPVSSNIEGADASPVEAAAACWLAVLNAARAEAGKEERS